MSNFTFKQLQRDLRTLECHSLALEGFYQVLEGQESVSGPTARAMRIALEAVDPSFANEDSNEGITGKDLVTGLKKTMHTVKNVIQWLLRMIGTLVEKFGVLLKRLGTKQKRLEKAVAGLTSQAEDAPNTVRFSGAEQLYVGDEFLGNDITQLGNLQKAVQYLWIDHPKALAQILRVAEGFGLNASSSTDTAAYRTRLADAIASNIKLPGFGETSINEYSEVGAEGGNLKASIPLLGNRGIIIRDPGSAKELLHSDDPLAGIRDALTLVIGVYKEPNINQEVPLPSLNEIKALNDALGQVVSITEKESAINQDLKKQADLLYNLIGNLGDPDSGKYSETHNQVIRMLGAIVTATGEPLTKCCEYISRTVNAELNYLSAAVVALGGEIESE